LHSRAALKRRLRTGWRPAAKVDRASPTRERRRLYERLRRSALAVLCGWLALSSTARAADSEEFWPELSAYVRLNPQTRIFLDTSLAKGKESDVESWDTGAYVDVTLKALEGRSLLNMDWQQSRSIWTRIGYDRVFDAVAKPRSVTEDRGILALYGKVLLPGAVMVESRARADLRWIGGDYSTRFRFRVEASREFSLLDHSVVPYFNVECFYDTRYDGWARVLYQAGSEVTTGEHFRFEVYLAHQADRLAKSSSLNAGGVVAKWYY
jgi:hypothetical protein